MCFGVCVHHMPFAAVTMFNWSLCVALMLLKKDKKNSHLGQTGVRGVSQRGKADTLPSIWEKTLEYLVPRRCEWDRKMKS